MKTTKTTKRSQKQERMTVKKVTGVTYSDTSGNRCTEEEHRQYARPWLDAFPRLMMTMTPPEIAQRGMILDRLGIKPKQVRDVDADDLRLALDMLASLHK